jgi:hypothetical protein
LGKEDIKTKIKSKNDIVDIEEILKEKEIQLKELKTIQTK